MIQSIGIGNFPFFQAIDSKLAGVGAFGFTIAENKLGKPVKVLFFRHKNIV